VNDSDPLYGARLRQERALEHLADIREQVEAIYNHFSTPSHQPHADGGSFIRIPRPHDPPPELAVRVGEMIYNLRAALDYVVFEIAHHDSGVKQNGTQFPVEDRPEGFAGRRKSFLKGVSDEHVALIESYQPYEGCRWTTLLVSLSNPDKHRQLHVLLTEVGSELEASTGTGHSPEDLDRLDRFYSESRRDFFVGKRRRMDVKVKATADVTFVGGPSWRRWRR